MTDSRTPSPTFTVREWQLVLTLCAATLMTGIDFSIVTVAMPDIGRDLDFSRPEDLQWVATACLLPTASLLPLFGRATDVLGRRRLFLVGIAGFSVLSLVAAIAVSPAMLLVGRVGQGISAAAIAPTAIALMTTTFSEGPRRARVLGLNGAMLAFGFVLGTIGGGLITSFLGWRWTMALLVVMGAGILVSALTVLPRVDRRTEARLDVPGAVLAAGGLFALVYAVSTANEAGWTSAPILLGLAASALMLVAFALVQAHARDPLIPLRLLRRPTIAWGGLVGLATYGLCGGTTILLSIYMQDVLGWSALQTGLAFIGEGVAAIIAGNVATRFVAGRRGALLAMVAGLAVQGVATVAMVALPATPGAGLPVLVATSTVMGFGHVLTVVAVVTIMTSGLPDEDQGVAGGLAQLPLYVGAVLNAVLAAIAGSRSDALGTTTSPELATLGGVHAATLTAGTVLLTCAVVAAVAVAMPRRAPARPDPRPSPARSGH